MSVVIYSVCSQILIYFLLVCLIVYCALVNEDMYIIPEVNKVLSLIDGQGTSRYNSTGKRYQDDDYGGDRKRRMC